jgi:hypothetical protein
MRIFRVMFASLMMLGVAACGVSQNLSKNVQFTPPPGPFKVAVMKPDVELFLLTAGGLAETNAEWSETAKSNLLAALENQIVGQGGQVMIASKIMTDAQSAKQIADLERLHRAVGATIFTHTGQSIFPLPTKVNKFDWTLGDQARVIGEKTGADYALFLFARDSFSSGGRVVLQVLLAGAGVGIAGGQQLSFVSLVDLKTGNIVWFNVLSKTTGDLRKMTGATVSVAELIKGMPVTPQAAKSTVVKTNANK